MGLTQYRRKRHFKQTPEPEGAVPHRVGPLRFVVQKHHASRLHYDFRLELDGVLKSWAIPKGPSLDPKDKRLAMMVEDHPLEYRTFEGIIPKGNYGAGTVMVWDEGTYAAAETLDPSEGEATLRKGLEKGHLRLVLQGQKLRGEFALVKLRKGEENAWLLFKKNDPFAERADVRSRDLSAVSGRTLEEIANEAAASGDVWTSNRNALTEEMQDAPRSKPPRNVEPMLATLVDKPFDRAGWLFEIKWDGYRAIAEIGGNGVRLYSRNQLSFNERYHPVVDALEQLKHEAVLDGEIVIVDHEGKPRFQLLQNYQKTGEGQLVYFVFDLLYLDGRDLRSLPLSRRKKILQTMLGSHLHIRLSEHVEQKGKLFFKAAKNQGLEGIMAKDGASPYREGKRTHEWLKIKSRRRQEAVIGGFTEPRGGRKALGALVLGLYDDDKLVYVGHTGGGFDGAALAEVKARLEPLMQKSCPFSKPPATNAPVHWVRPKLVCEVAFQEWTDDGHMRQPIYLGLREDKPAKKVRREEPEPDL